MLKTQSAKLSDNWDVSVFGCTMENFTIGQSQFREKLIKIIDDCLEAGDMSLVDYVAWFVEWFYLLAEDENTPPVMTILW